MPQRRQTPSRVGLKPINELNQLWQLFKFYESKTALVLKSIQADTTWQMKEIETSMADNVFISIVIPCFNEEDVLPQLIKRLTNTMEQLGCSWEVIFVDDGSKDDTLQMLFELHQRERRFKTVSLSRNFGHQVAVAAGLEYASGKVVVVMDADLQDPPELLPSCLEKWRDGNDVVYCVRQERVASPFLRLFYKLFYRLLYAVSNFKIPLDTGDFCLMDRKVVDKLVIMKERNMFVRGLRSWVGFRQVGISYRRPPRVSGETKYPIMKLVKLAADGIFSFSVVPLRLAIWFGFICVFLSLCYVAFVLAWKLIGFKFLGLTSDAIPGWTSVIVSIVIFGSIQLVFMGLIGEYIGRIYDEVKGRPRWIVNDKIGFDAEDPVKTANNT